MGKKHKKAQHAEKAKRAKPMTKAQAANDAEDLMILQRQLAYYRQFTRETYDRDVAEQRKKIDAAQAIINGLDEKWINRDATILDLEKKLRKGKTTFLRKKNARRIESLEKLTEQALALEQELKEHGVDISEIVKKVKI